MKDIEVLKFKKKVKKLKKEIKKLKLERCYHAGFGIDTDKFKACENCPEDKWKACTIEGMKNTEFLCQD